MTAAMTPGREPGVKLDSGRLVLAQVLPRARRTRVIDGEELHDRAHDEVGLYQKPRDESHSLHAAPDCLSGTRVGCDVAGRELPVRVACIRWGRGYGEPARVRQVPRVGERPDLDDGGRPVG